MWLAGETEVLGETLPPHHIVHHKSHLPDPGANPGRRGGKPAPNRFSYGTAMFQTHYLSENLVAPGIEPGISGSVARNSDH
jgi:hypothetical protein